MTFDDFIERINDRYVRDLWIDLSDEVDQWTDGGKLSSEETGGPVFDSLETLLYWGSVELRGWHPAYLLRWIWEAYLDVNGMMAAGIDFEIAHDAAMTVMCDGCGCDWHENMGPGVPDDVWLLINKPIRSTVIATDGLLCADCIEGRLRRIGRLDLVRRVDQATQSLPASLGANEEAAWVLP
jgi:hypothetical protein